MKVKLFCVRLFLLALKFSNQCDVVRAVYTIIYVQLEMEIVKGSATSVGC